MLLDDIGVTEECLLEIVQKVSVEHEIADWLRRNADLSSVASLNEKLFSPRIEDVLAFIPAATFNEIYPAAERMTITSPMFEVLLEDDRLMFPSHFQNGSHPHERFQLSSATTNGSPMASAEFLGVRADDSDVAYPKAGFETT